MAASEETQSVRCTKTSQILNNFFLSTVFPLSGKSNHVLWFIVGISCKCSAEVGTACKRTAADYSVQLSCASNQVMLVQELRIGYTASYPCTTEDLACPLQPVNKQNLAYSFLSAPCDHRQTCEVVIYYLFAFSTYMCPQGRGVRQIAEIFYNCHDGKEFRTYLAIDTRNMNSIFKIQSIYKFKNK